MIEVAMELEKIALSDEYFVKRKLYPNVDFYSGVIYKALGIPTDMFTVLFTIPRIAGWLAHWTEFLDDPDNKIVRPRQIYKGYAKRDYVASDKREKTADYELEYVIDTKDARREASLEFAKKETKKSKAQPAGADKGSASPGMKHKSELVSAAEQAATTGAAGDVLDMPVDPNEPTYCICSQVSYGQMIACDNPECPIEWFHIGCMGLSSIPKGKWYCPKCLPSKKK